MKERLIIVFVAIILGLVITTAGFFIYQSAKTVPESTDSINSKSNKLTSQPVAKNDGGLELVVDAPKDESITDTRTIEVKGKTNPENIIIVSTNQEDIVGKATSEGQFSLSVVIDAGTNKIITRSISPTGEELKDERIITFTTEDF